MLRRAGGLLRIARLDVGERLRADQILQPRAEDVGARQADALGERGIGLHQPQIVVGDGHEIDERIERVFEQAALAQHVVEQQDVLDRDRQLAGQIVRDVEHGLVGQRAVAGEDERAEGAAPSPQRRDDQAVAPGRRVEPQGVRGVVRGVVSRDPRTGGLGAAGGRRQGEHPAAPVVQPDFGRRGAEDLPDAGGHQLEGGRQAEGLRDLLRELEDELAQALVEPHLRICDHK